METVNAQWALDMVSQVEALNTGCNGDSHEKEDEIYLQFIRHVAETGPRKLAEIAKILLRTQEIADINRWYE